MKSISLDWFWAELNAFNNTGSDVGLKDPQLFSTVQVYSGFNQARE